MCRLNTLFLFLSTLSLSSYAEQCNPSDKKVLLQIKAHFNNAPIFAAWNPTTDCCTSWGGIVCDAGRVTTLAVGRDNTLVGAIPPVMGDLPFLQYLTFSDFPGLTGPIPSALSKLTKLVHIDFSLNNLTGPIPDFLGQLTELDDIDLSVNSLTGPIPSSLGRLTKINTINLEVNKLSGPIPESIAQIKSLVQLYLFSNSLTGPIPPSFAELPLLNELALGQNQLTGSIPESFGSLKNPQLHLDVSSNKLSGPIPMSFGKANITVLDLSNNTFTGDASFLFGSKKTVLSSIKMSNNRFKFDFSNVDLPPGLKTVDVSHNVIYGSLPMKLGQLPLQYIDVSFNRLCGPIPAGRRLKQFSPVVFSNNKCLCGPPLPPC